MAIIFTPTNHYKWGLQRGIFNLKAQSHDLTLTFGKCDTGVTSISVTALKFNRAAGSFLTDGFCVGQEIVTTGFTDAANNGRYVITAVTASDISVAEVLVNEAASGNEQIQSTRDDTISRAAGSFLTDLFTVGDIIYTNSANAGNQGPFIVRNAIALKMVVMPVDGTLPAMTAGAETNLTVGTYIIKARLARSGFTFSQDNHATLSNIKGTIGPIATIAFVDGGAGNDSITDSGAGFLTAGFVAGNSITVSGSGANDGTYTIISVVAGTIEVATGSLAAEGAGAAVTITADDELATGSGYTQGAKLTGTWTAHSEDDTNNRGNATFPSITCTPSAAATIGPTPGLILELYSSTDNTIMGYVDFGGNESATDPTQFTITGLTLRES